MSSCSVCFGNGILTTGRFAPCARCGGNSSVDQRNQAAVICSSCNGSGTSNKELLETCWSCQGSGNIDDGNFPALDAKSRRTPRSIARSRLQENQTTRVIPESVLKENRRSPIPIRSQSEPKVAVRRSDSAAVLTLLSLVLAIAAGLVTFQLEGDSGLTLGVVISTFIVANIVLRVIFAVLTPLFTVLKLPLTIIFFLATAVVIGNLAEVEIAQEIFSYIDSILAELNWP